MAARHQRRESKALCGMKSENTFWPLGLLFVHKPIYWKLFPSRRSVIILIILGFWTARGLSTLLNSQRFIGGDRH
jgi:hypothetical protein